MPETKCSIAVLISGNGSNLQALIDASHLGNYTIGLVISNKSDAYGLERARRANIATQVIDHREYANREDFDAALMAVLDAERPQLIVLAGFMRILSSAFVQHYQGLILNIHPSLLPKYPGTNTHQRAIDAGETEHGVSVHFVTEELDGGPVIAQERVPVLPQDTARELAARVAAQEHVLYPQVVTWFAAGRLVMRDQRAWLDDRLLPPSGA
jgi:phosphoribosylglycinamide formyltransferase-1